MDIQPFEINIADEVLSDLRDRLRRTRWPDQVVDSAWAYGTDQAYLRELVHYWIEKFDWRAQEKALIPFGTFSPMSTAFACTSSINAGAGRNRFRC